MMTYHWPLPEPDLEQEAQRIAEAVLKVLRIHGDNLAVLAAIRRALVENPAECACEPPPRS
jgi:hypothetical protein